MTGSAWNKSQFTANELLEKRGWLTVNMTAVLLDYPKSALEEMIEDGRVEAFRFGKSFRLYKEGIERLILYGPDPSGTYDPP